MEEGLCILTGTVVGAIISFISALILDRLKNKREDNVHIQEKREAVYNEMICLIGDINTRVTPHDSIKNLKNIKNDIFSKYRTFMGDFLLFSSEEAKKEFFKVFKALNTIEHCAEDSSLNEIRKQAYDDIMLRNEIIIDIMKKELGTLEKQKTKGFQCNLCSWIQSKFSAK